MSDPTLNVTVEEKVLEPAVTVVLEVKEEVTEDEEEEEEEEEGPEDLSVTKARGKTGMHKNLGKI